MVYKKGIYRLVREDKYGGKEIFDFDSRTFLPKEYVDGKFSLSSIDSLTTKFNSVGQLNYYTSCGEYWGYGDDSYIEYTYNGKNKTLPTIWNDKRLSDIASNTIGEYGGRVDYNNKNALIFIRDFFVNIEKNYRFYEAYLNSRAFKNINNHNMELLSQVYETGRKSERNAEFFYSKVMKSFENYKEFREIYMFYRSYMDKQAERVKKVMEEEEKKLKLELKKGNVPKEFDFYD